MQVIRIFKRGLIGGDVIYFSNTIVGKVSGASKYLSDSRNLKSRIQNWETYSQKDLLFMSTTDRKKHG